MPRRKYPQPDTKIKAVGRPQVIKGLGRVYKPGIEYEPTIENAAILRSLVTQRGRIAAMAEELGCTSAMIYARMREIPKLRERFEDWHEKLLDKVLDAAEIEIGQGNTAVILQLLKMLGSRRGLGERIIIEGGDKPVKSENTFKLELGTLNIEERRFMLKAYQRVSPNVAGEQRLEIPQQSTPFDKESDNGWEE